MRGHGGTESTAVEGFGRLGPPSGSLSESQRYIYSFSPSRYHNVTENAKLGFYHLAGQCRSLVTQCFNTHVDERDSPRSTFLSPDNSRL
jgi:hypothetical protein